MTYEGLGPAAALQSRIISIFRADPVLNTPDTGLLFPPWSKQVNGDDVRIYEADVELPENPDVREALPRILIESIQMVNAFEQGDVAEPHAPVAIIVHSMVPKEESELGELIDRRCAVLIGSTPLSTASIIAAELVPDGQRRRERVTAFNGAWWFASRYHSADVGVLG